MGGGGGGFIWRGGVLHQQGCMGECCKLPHRGLGLCHRNFYTFGGLMCQTTLNFSPHYAVDYDFARMNLRFYR